LSIEFDVDYNVDLDVDGGSPFHMSADAVPVIFGSMITVTVKILKVKGTVSNSLVKSVFSVKNRYLVKNLKKIQNSKFGSKLEIFKNRKSIFP